MVIVLTPIQLRNLDYPSERSLRHFLKYINKLIVIIIRKINTIKVTKKPQENSTLNQFHINWKTQFNFISVLF